MARINVSMKALIFFERKFLLIQEQVGDSTIWDLPGGTIEFGEDPIKTLHREVFEEVGIEITIQKPVGVYAFINHTKEVYVVCNLFKAKPVDKPIIDITNNPAQEDIISYGWFKKNDIERLRSEGLLESVANILEKNQL